MSALVPEAKASYTISHYLIPYNLQFSIIKFTLI